MVIFLEERGSSLDPLCSVSKQILNMISDHFFFSDHLCVSNPTSRDKLLAAVHELKLFGGPVPDERQFRLNAPGSNNKVASPRTKKRSLPARPLDMQLLPDGNYKMKLMSFLLSKNVRKTMKMKVKNR